MTTAAGNVTQKTGCLLLDVVAALRARTVMSVTAMMTAPNIAPGLSRKGVHDFFEREKLAMFIIGKILLFFLGGSSSIGDIGVHGLLALASSGAHAS